MLEPNIELDLLQHHIGAGKTWMLVASLQEPGSSCCNPLLVYTLNKHKYQAKSELVCEPS